MLIHFDHDSGLSIQGEWICLESIFPVLNGQIIRESTIKRLVQGEDAFALQYTAPQVFDGVITLELVPEGQEKCRLRYHVRDYSGELNSFGIHISEIQNLKTFLRNGYHSWDGSSYEDPESWLTANSSSSRVVTGFGMTQLIPRYGSGSMILGFDRHDRYQQTFSFQIQRSPVSLTIQTVWDQKQTASGIVNSSEWLEIFDHNEIEQALLDWARLIAAASPTPPRLDSPSISGWCSWYQLYGYITEEVILDHLEGFATWKKSVNFPDMVFQIDDGFTPEMGDWLKVKPQFPSGMKPILDEIRSAGLTPGLWIAPFMVGNRSQLFHQHPDWVLQERGTGQPFVQWKLYAENRWFKRSEEYYILDATHPEAFEYLRSVFRTWKVEWGCEYFKTDFLYFGCAYGPEDVVYHTPGKTRIEIWRSVAEMIRQEIGDSIWLGCGCPLWASVGLVDAVRISGDVGVQWHGDLAAESLLRDLVTRNFANHILWQIDPDCILLRNKFHHLTDLEVQSLAIFAGFSGGVVMTSDHLGELDQSRLSLWRLLLPDGRRKARIPFLGTSPVIYRHKIHRQDGDDSQLWKSENLDPVIILVRDADNPEGPHAVYIFNTCQKEVQRTIPLESIGFRGPLYLYEWPEYQQAGSSQWQVQAKLRPHEGKLFFLSRNPLTDLSPVLP